MPTGALQVAEFGAHGVLAALCSIHVLLTKREPRSAMGWIAVCCLFPFAGSALYYAFGINRTKARARQLWGGSSVVQPLALERRDPADPNAALVHIGQAVTQRPLLRGNALRLLENGEGAYPAMLAAIEHAQRTVWMSTYLYGNDTVGDQFTAALQAAVQRGVAVRMLIDGVGGLYSWPDGVTRLRRAGVPAARFLPPRLIPPMLYLNLRNHRKLLLVDGETGFVGGMNIGAANVIGANGQRAVADLHFQVAGPVLDQLAEAFIVDWQFTTGEALESPPAADHADGDSACRVITDGPDEDVDKLVLVMIGALSIARHRVLLMTPYFIPTVELVSALQSAALRGVDVILVLPARSNLRYVDWASRNWLLPLLEHGVRVFLQPEPFAHTKLLVIDDGYAQIGSANLDSRSLRLNFEIVVEVMGGALCAALADHIGRAQARSAELPLQTLTSRSVATRLRDGAFWLASPYL